jgi:hypothetical protein
MIHRSKMSTFTTNAPSKYKQSSDVLKTLQYLDTSCQHHHMCNTPIMALYAIVRKNAGEDYCRVCYFSTSMCNVSETDSIGVNCVERRDILQHLKRTLKQYPISSLNTRAVISDDGIENGPIRYSNYVTVFAYKALAEESDMWVPPSPVIAHPPATKPLPPVVEAFVPIPNSMKPMPASSPPPAITLARFKPAGASVVHEEPNSGAHPISCSNPMLNMFSAQLDSSDTMSSRQGMSVDILTELESKIDKPDHNPIIEPIESTSQQTEQRKRKADEINSAPPVKKIVPKKPLINTPKPRGRPRKVNGASESDKSESPAKKLTKRQIAKQLITKTLNKRKSVRGRMIHARPIKKSRLSGSTIRGLPKGVTTKAKHPIHCALPKALCRISRFQLDMAKCLMRHPHGDLQALILNKFSEISDDNELANMLALYTNCVSYYLKNRSVPTDFKMKQQTSKFHYNNVSDRNINRISKTIATQILDNIVAFYNSDIKDHPEKCGSNINKYVFMLHDNDYSSDDSDEESMAESDNDSDAHISDSDSETHSMRVARVNVSRP